MDWQARYYPLDVFQSLEEKIEAMIQTVTMAQQLFAKAALVDAQKLVVAQKRCDLVAAESLLQDVFATDVRPAIHEWRDSKGLPKDPTVYSSKLGRRCAMAWASDAGSAPGLHQYSDPSLTSHARDEPARAMPVRASVGDRPDHQTKSPT